MTLLFQALSRVFFFAGQGVIVETHVFYTCCFDPNKDSFPWPQGENTRLYAVIDRLNLRGSDACSDTCSQLSDPPSVYGHREVVILSNDK